MRVHRAAFAAVLALVAASIPAVQGNAGPAAAAAWPQPIVQPSGTVRGVVTDAGTGAPIAGACVDVFVTDMAVPRGQKCTGADGRYEFAGIHVSMSITLGVTAAGYPRQWWPHSVDQVDTFTLSLGEVKVADFPLTAATTVVSGQLKQPDGQPAPQGFIELFRVEAVSRTAIIMSGQDGAFGKAVPPGNYHLRYRWDNHPMQWLGGTTDRATATVFTVGATPPAPLALQLPVPATPPTPRIRGTVTGKVTTSSGAPVAGATVRINTISILYGEAVTDADGKYSIPGIQLNFTYRVEINAPGRPRYWAPSRPVSSSTTISAAAPVVNAVLPDQIGTLSGRILDYDGGPVSAAAVLRVHADDVYMPFLTIYPKLDGTYSVPNLAAGKYRLSVAGLAGRPAQFHPVMPTWAEASTVTVPAAGSVVVDETMMGPTYTEITVRDSITGQPVPGACANQTCAGEDGIVRFGPSWQIQPTNNMFVQVGLGHVYHSQSLVIPEARGQINRTEVALRPGAALQLQAVDWRPGNPFCVQIHRTTFRAGDGDPGWERVCATRTSINHVVIGPIEPGPMRLFVEASGSGDTATGAQWINADGQGSGRAYEAGTFDLRLRSMLDGPAVSLTNAGSIHGIVRSQATGQPIAGACLRTMAETFQVCTDHNGSYRIDGLAVGWWPIYVTAQGYAVQWIGGMTNAKDGGGPWVGMNEPWENDVYLTPQGELHGIKGYQYPNDGIVDVFDAWSGDYLPGGWAGDQRITGLNTGKILLRYRYGYGPDCWVHLVDSRVPNPYFAVEGGKVTTVNMEITPGVNCFFTEPALLGPDRQVAPRRDVVGSGHPVSLRRTGVHFGAFVQQEIAKIWPQQP